ncbi:MAG TPA: DUF6766 family protein [Terrimicrobiaceae bacterium]
MKSFLRNNGLSIVLATLFVLFLGGQTNFGWLHYNDEQEQHHQPQVGLAQYLTTSAFGEAVFENWESEFLQMGVYVVLTAFLFQKGSAESKDPQESEEEASKSPLRDAPLPVKKGGLLLKLYNHSLSLALAALFGASFIGHAICGAGAYNEEAAQHGREQLSTFQYLGTSQFWFESFQNWQSEFLAILSIVVLSIWLREKGSPESKPVTASHSQTGR